MSYISDTDECRRLARNVVTADFDDSQIQSYQTKEYSYIATITDKDDWDSLDREFGALQNIETKLVANDIKQHYGDINDFQVFQAERQAILMELDKIVDNMDTEEPESSIDFEVTRTDFKGWTLGNSEPPNRLNGNASVDTEGF